MSFDFDKVNEELNVAIANGNRCRWWSENLWKDIYEHNLLRFPEEKQKIIKKYFEDKARKLGQHFSHFEVKPILSPTFQAYLDTVNKFFHHFYLPGETESGEQLHTPISSEEQRKYFRAPELPSSLTQRQQRGRIVRRPRLSPLITHLDHAEEQEEPIEGRLEQGSGVKRSLNFKGKSCPFVFLNSRKVFYKI